MLYFFLAFNFSIFSSYFNYSFDFSKNAHDYHVAIAEMEWNDTQKTWEVMLKVYSDDLEDALTKQEGKKTTVQTHKKAPNIALQKYINTHFYFESPTKSQLIGAELENDMYSIYVEFSLKNPSKSKNFTYSIFFEMFNDQLNMLNMKYKGKKKTFLYQKGKEKQIVNTN